MAKRMIKTTASTLVLLLTFGVACVSFAAPTLREQRSRLPQGCASRAACGELNIICVFGPAPGLSTEPVHISSSPKDISKDSLLPVETGSRSYVPDEILLTSRGILSANHLVFSQKISIHLLNSVLTL
jgi:hypothetical protein